MRRQLSSAQLQLSSAAQCRAVPCLALRCGAVLCFLSYSARYYAKYQVSGTRYRVPVCKCALVFLLSPLVVFSRSTSCLLFASCTRTRCTADQNATSPATAQPSTAQSALHKRLLVLSNRHVVAPNHQPIGLLSLPPSLLCSSLSERSGRRQPPAERRAKPLNILYLLL